jgi:hypothetical protein
MQHPLLAVLALAGALLLADAACAGQRDARHSRSASRGHNDSYQLAGNDRSEQRQNRGDRDDDNKGRERRTPRQDAPQSGNGQNARAQQVAPGATEAQPRNAPRRDQMSADDRQRLQQREREFRSLSREEQQRLRATEQRYQQLSPQQRDDLRRQWERMSESERERYRQRIDQNR